VAADACEVGNQMKLRSAFALLFALCAILTASGASSQPRMPLIVVLIHGTENAIRPRLDALRGGLRELGYHEKQDYRMEVRWSDNRVERLPQLARDLLGFKPDVVVAGPVIAARAFHRESKTIPIVMTGGAGAQRVGLIASLARPGGNVTGLTNQGDELTPKLFELLRELAPLAKRVLVLSSGLGAAEPDVRAGSRVAAKAYGLTLIEAFAESPSQLPLLAGRCARERCEALVSLLDPNLTNIRGDVIALAAGLRIPAVYPNINFAEGGGLISYSTDILQMARRAATYVDKILKGAKPKDLPVERPTKFELVVNQTTAKTLGLKIPESILVRADRVIE
jgi:putative ABC transport system substrate-binding protein